MGQSDASRIVRPAIDKGKNNGSLRLFNRELEVLRSAAKGLRNKEIASNLSISERTVQAHLSNIFSKLDVSSRNEAVLKGLKEGYLNLSDLS